MITVSISEKQIHMIGHAGCHVNGQDIVCAAISALTCSLVNSLRQLAGVPVETEEYSGYMDVQWEEMNEAGRLLIDSWFLGIAAINSQYNCITFV